MISRADTCRERAKECRTKAVKTRSVPIRYEYLRLASRWEEAAKEADYSENSSNDQRLLADA